MQPAEVDLFSHVDQLRDIAGLRRESLAVGFDFGDESPQGKAHPGEAHELSRKAHVGDPLALVELAFQHIIEIGGPGRCEQILLIVE